MKLQEGEFAELIMQNKQVMIFIDEAGINMWTKRTRRRVRIEERAVNVVRGTRARNFTVMVFAVSPANGWIHQQRESGGMNGERYIQFLTAVADNLPHNGTERMFRLRQRARSSTSRKRTIS